MNINHNNLLSSKYSTPQFITFEGGEGSGKSTQSKLLHEYLLENDIRSIHTREIGGTVEAEKIRNLLLHSKLFPISELMLVMAARYEHINKIIIPALLDGKWVICDRFIDSTACYQSSESGLGMDDIYSLHNNLMKAFTIASGQNNLENQIVKDDFKQKAIMPNLTFFMDIPPQIALKRAIDRGDLNKFEDKNIAFHNRIYNSFKEIALKHKGRFISIKSIDRSVDEIHRDIISYI